MKVVFLGPLLLATQVCLFAVAEPTIISRDDSLASKAPVEAFEGVGCWQVGDYIVATGHSICINALGEAKGKRAERDIAEDDSRGRMVRFAALKIDSSFDSGAYKVEAVISGFQTAAIYRIPGHEGIFLVGRAKSNGVRVQITFDMARARQSAVAAFDYGDYSRAARILADLTNRGAQDAETAALAYAASAHVNLAAGVKGNARTAALRTLSDFYLNRGDSENALRFFFDLYQDSPSPDRVLLERLAELSTKTNRENNATAFKNEIERRWPPPP